MPTTTRDSSLSRAKAVPYGMSGPNTSTSSRSHQTVSWRSETAPWRGCGCWTRILEVNQANVAVVLGDFQKDFKQPDGKPRKGKVMIRKKDIHNFLIYTKSIEVPASD